MGIISKKTAGWLLLFGLGSILALNLVLIKPFFFWLVVSLGLFLTIIFLYQPLWGMGLFLLIRNLGDDWGEKTSLRITENFSLGANALLGILVSSLLFWFLLKNFSSWKIIPFKKSWLIIIILSLVSLLYTFDLGQTLRESARLTSIFLFFAAAFLLSQKKENSQKITDLILFSAIPPFLAALWQMASQAGLGGTLGLDGRLFGTFSHPNTFAAFVLIVLAVTGLQFYQEKNSSRKKMLLVFIFLALFLLLETFSRGAWLAFLILLLTLSLFKSPKIFLLSIFLFLAAFAFSENFRFRLQDIYNPSPTSSVQWRIQQWERGWTSWMKKPWQGWGAGTEILVFEKQYGFYSGNPYTHNDFLRMGIELGIIGFAAYTLLAITVFFRLFQSLVKNQKPEQKTALIFGLAIFLAISFFSLTSNLFRATAVQWSLWFFLATLFGPALENKNT